MKVRFELGTIKGIWARKTRFIAVMYLIPRTLLFGVPHVVPIVQNQMG